MGDVTRFGRCGRGWCAIEGQGCMNSVGYILHSGWAYEHT